MNLVKLATLLTLAAALAGCNTTDRLANVGAVQSIPIVIGQTPTVRGMTLRLRHHWRHRRHAKHRGAERTPQSNTDRGDHPLLAFCLFACDVGMYPSGFTKNVK